MWDNCVFDTVSDLAAPIAAADGCWPPSHECAGIHNAHGVSVLPTVYDLPYATIMFH